MLSHVLLRSIRFPAASCRISYIKFQVSTTTKQNNPIRRYCAFVFIKQILPKVYRIAEVSPILSSTWLNEAFIWLWWYNQYTHGLQVAWILQLTYIALVVAVAYSTHISSGMSEDRGTLDENTLVQCMMNIVQDISLLLLLVLPWKAFGSYSVNVIMMGHLSLGTFTTYIE